MTIIQQPPPKGSTSKTKAPRKTGVNATFVALEWVRALHLDAWDKSLLSTLAGRSNKNYEAWPGRKRLAREAGYKSIPTMMRHLRALEEKGLIAIEHRLDSDGRQTSNLYKLLVPAKYKGGYLGSTPPPLPNGYPPGTSHGERGVSQGYPNYTDNYSGNSPEGIDNQQDETQCDPSGSHDTDHPDVSAEIIEEQNLAFDQEMDKAQKKKIEQNHIEAQKKLAHHFPVTANYQKPKLTANAMASFWWSCIERYHPADYSPDKKFTSKQADRLWELFDMFDKPISGLVVIEWCIRYWDTVGEKAIATNWMSKPPKNPTPTWIVSNLEHCTEYYSKTSPLKVGNY